MRIILRPGTPPQLFQLPDAAKTSSELWNRKDGDNNSRKKIRCINDETRLRSQVMKHNHSIGVGEVKGRKERRLRQHRIEGISSNI